MAERGRSGVLCSITSGETHELRLVSRLGAFHSIALHLELAAEELRIYTLARVSEEVSCPSREYPCAQADISRLGQSIVSSARGESIAGSIDVLPPMTLIITTRFCRDVG